MRLIIANQPMNRFRASSGFVLLLWISTIASAGAQVVEPQLEVPQPETYAGQPSARFAQALKQIREKHKLPGLIAGQFDTRQVLHLQSVGVRRVGSSEPLLVSDAMHLGSCTKSMTATMVAMAVDQGLITWQTTLAEVFPKDTIVTDSPWANVTIEQMMHHTSGALANPPWSEYRDPERSVRVHRQNILHWWMEQPREDSVSDDAASEFLYSNLGYTTLGAVLEQLRDEPWETQIRNQLFEPLGIKSAGFGVPSKTLGATAVSGHVVRDGQYIAVENDNPPALGPAGTVYAPMEDWIRYLQLHLREKSSDTPQPVLSQESFRYLHEPLTQQEYAGGWRIIQRNWSKGPIYTHNGSNTYWFCVVYLAPHEGRGILAASNLGLDAAVPCDEALQWMLKNLPFNSPIP